MDVQYSETRRMPGVSTGAESVQSLYSRYRRDGLIVNRRYQRKLVWTEEEKILFVDSIFSDLPVPLILVAESTQDELEVVDGMQRLDAIMSFIENRIAWRDAYFDLGTVADAKALLDAGKLEQREPVLNREQCLDFVNYQLPMTTYRGSSEEEIDEVFRRINSYGKSLSRQELRQAGVSTRLAALVRKISATVRGDQSVSDRLELGAMSQISITSRNLDYGISVNDVYWVEQGILRPLQVRESADEELIADLILGLALDELPPSRSELLDEYYGLAGDEGRSVEVDQAIGVHGEDALQGRFFTVFEAIRRVVRASDKRFADLLMEESSGRLARYYQVVFLAFARLMIDESRELLDVEGLARALDGLGTSQIDIQTGGRWSAEKKRLARDAVKGVAEQYFGETNSLQDPAANSWVMRFEALLRNAGVEQSQVEFKQGLLSLGATREPQADLIERIANTLTAMANMGPNSSGYVVLGVADRDEDGGRIVELDGIEVAHVGPCQVVGLDREATLQSLSMDEYFQQIRSQLHAVISDEDFGREVIGRSRLVRYRDLSCLVLEAPSLGQPVAQGDSFYERSGSNTMPVPVPEFTRIFARFGGS